MAEVTLNNGLISIVDDEDFALVSQFKWYASKSCGRIYPLTNIKTNEGRKLLRMHRLLLNPPAGQLVDHIDGDSLNNTRANLRLCTQKENLRNRGKDKVKNPTSKYKGVSLNRRSVNMGQASIWRATLNVDGKQIHIGSYPTEVDAAVAYNTFAIKHYGEFAYINSIDEEAAVRQKKEGAACQVSTIQP